MLKLRGSFGSLGLLLLLLFQLCNQQPTLVLLRRQPLGLLLLFGAIVNHTAR